MQARISFKDPPVPFTFFKTACQSTAYLLSQEKEREVEEKHLLFYYVLSSVSTDLYDLFKSSQQLHSFMVEMIPILQIKQLRIRNNK